MTDHIEVTDRRHVSESALLDQDSLDPKYHYRFVQERPTQIARAKLRGYRLVQPSEDGVRTLYDQEDKPAENIIKHGDRVLMRVPKVKHAENRKVIRERAAQKLTTSEQQVREKARQARVEIHDRDEKEDE